MKNLLILFVASFLATSATSQTITNLMVTANDTKQLDFTNDPPNIYDTGIYSFESIAHTEDQDGDILFWINSDGVYDADFNIMDGSTGMYANSSSAEMNICPMPGEPLKYYVIYNAETCSDLYYAIVDMELNDGLGGIVTTNELFASGDYSEGLEVVNIPCTDTYRLLAFNCDEGFVSFDIDEDGFGEEVLLYELIPGGNWDGRGELDYHNGRIGQAFAYSTVIFLGDYSIIDNEITNPIEMSQTWGCGGFDLDYTGAYGMEFSLDGGKAYIANWFSCNPNALLIYDFDSGVANFYSGYSNLGQIELGPDGKLYIAANYAWDYDLLVIEDPESNSPTISEFDLGETSGLGLSDHIQSNLFSSFALNVDGNCVGDIASVEVLSIIDAGELDITWSVNGEELDPSELTEPGLYEFPADEAGEWVFELTLDASGCTQTVEEIITIYDPDTDLLPENVTGCEGQSVTLEAPGDLDEIFWSTGETSLQIEVDEPGSITLTGNVASCFLSDEILVDFTEAPEVTLPPTAGFCEGESIDITAETNGESFEWSTGDTELTINVDEPGEIDFVAYNAECATEASIFVSSVNMPDLDWPDDTTACDVEALTLNAGAGFESYVWNGTVGGPTYTANGFEFVTLEVSNQDCVQEYALQVAFGTTPDLDMPVDVVVCDQPLYNIDITSNAQAYEWSTNQVSQDISVNESGTYEVTASNGDCSTTGEVEVLLGFSPNLGLQDIYFSCDGFVDIVVAAGAADEVDWSMGSDDFTVTIEEPGTYSVTGTNQIDGSSEVCTSFHEFEVNVLQPEELDPVLPNVFSPNGDQWNNVYSSGLRTETVMELQVYNRWGNLLFESDTADLGWDGTADGDDSPAGVYYVVLTFTNLCTDEEVTRTQDVHLMREP